MEIATSLYSDEFSRYFRNDDHSAIELHWSAATRSMTEEQFRDRITRLAEMLERTPAPNALVDIVNIQFAPSAEFEPWRQANIIPRYNAAGLRKLAFVVPANATSTVENGNAPALEGAAKFLTGYFSSRERALSWFDEP